MSSFVKFFMQEKHLKTKAGTPKKKPMSDVISRVFESLYRCDFGENVVRPYINIHYVAEYLKEQLPLQEEHCATAIIMHIFQTLSVEYIPKAIIDSVCSFERLN
jgi:hypothetical protein